MDTQGSTHAHRSLVAVVVTRNRLSELKETVACLLGSPSNVLQKIIVVDNASSDGTQDWLQSLKEDRIDLLLHTSNLGGAGGFETGLKRAFTTTAADWAVVMDDDARPYQGALEAFCASPREDHEAWAAAVFNKDQTICDMNRPFLNPARLKGGLWKVLRHGRSGFYLSDNAITGSALQPIHGASFVGLFISRRAAQRVGYPDGALFIYGDDVLYTLGLSEAGGTLAFDPTLKFEHNFTSQAASRGRFEPVWKSYYHHRNLLMIYRIFMGALFWPALVLLIPRWLLRARAYKGSRRAYMRLLTRAIKDGITHNTNASLAEIERLGE